MKTRRIYVKWSLETWEKYKKRPYTMMSYFHKITNHRLVSYDMNIDNGGGVIHELIIRID